MMQQTSVTDLHFTLECQHQGVGRTWETVPPARQEEIIQAPRAMAWPFRHQHEKQDHLVATE